MRGEGGRPGIAWSAHTYRIRQVAKQDTRARSGPQLSMFLQLAVKLIYATSLTTMCSLDATSAEGGV